MLFFCSTFVIDSYTMLGFIGLKNSLDKNLHQGWPNCDLHAALLYILCSSWK